MFGLSNASTMATVWPAPPFAGSLYALRRSAGPKPAGVAFGVIAPAAMCVTLAASVRRSARQDAKPGLLSLTHEWTAPGAAGAGAAAATCGPTPRARPA